MRERLVEHWLTRTNERGYQTAFCQLLVAQGYTIVHMSPHGPFAQGKDVIAIGPSGAPIAYQLKAGNITTQRWRTEIRAEIEELLDVPIKHPSVAPHGDHESWLVTSGNLAAMVRVEIHDRNERRIRDGKRPLRVKVGGELIAEFVAAHERYFPVDPPDLKRFLELYMADGRAELPKAEYAAFLVSTLPYNDSALSMRARGQAVSSAILLASYIAEPYRKTGNHWAVAAAWLVTAAHILALIDSTGANPRDWEQTLLLVEAALEQAVGQLTREVVERQEHLFDDGLFDPPTYRFRTTVLAGWLAGGLLYKLLKNEVGWRDEAVLELIERRLLLLTLWGEAAVPSFLNLMWCYGAFTRTTQRDAILETILRTRVQALGRADEDGLLNPYYGLDFGVRLATKSLRDPIFESFNGSSYTLETLVTLVTRYGLRDALAPLWRRITHAQFRQFVPRSPWETYMWRSEHGELRSRFPTQTQSWAALCEESRKPEEESVPLGLLVYKELMPLFFLVYPHRVRPPFVKALDTRLQAAGTGSV